MLIGNRLHLWRLAYLLQFAFRCKRFAGADKLANMLDSIETAATGSPTVKMDWRAADRMLQIVAKELYADQDASAAPQTTVSITIDRVLQLVNLADSGQLKQLTPASTKVIDITPAESCPQTVPKAE